MLIGEDANWWITATLQDPVSKRTHGSVPEHHQLSVFAWEVQMPKKVFFIAANTNISIRCWKDTLAEVS